MDHSVGSTHGKAAAQGDPRTGSIHPGPLRHNRWPQRSVRSSGPVSVTAIVFSKWARKAAVGRPHGPAVVGDEHVVAAEVEHRLDGEAHPRLDEQARCPGGRSSAPAAPRASIGRCRGRRRADDPVAARRGHRLDGVPDVAEPVAGMRGGDPASIPAASRRRGRPPRAARGPTVQVRAQSACQPSTMQPMSMLTTSPSASRRRGDGMPWTTSSLMLAQIDAGERRVRAVAEERGDRAGVAIMRAAIASRSPVVTPGRISPRSTSRMSARMRPAPRMRSISAGA